MRHSLSRSDPARSRAPGWWRRRFRRGRRSPGVGRPAPARTMFASGLALLVATLVVCLLSLPGFVLGAEAPVKAAVPPAEAAAAEVTAATASAIVAPAATEGEPIISAGTVLAALPWGDGEGQVGLALPAEGLARGPEAVAIAPDGRVAILDSVNHRLVLLDAQGAFSSTITVPLAEPRFLAVNDDRIYVLDCDLDRQLAGLAWTGEELLRLDLPALDDVVTGLFATKHGPCVEVAHESTYLLRSEGPVGTGKNLRDLPGRPLDPDLRRAAKAAFAPGKGVHVTTARVDQKTLKAEESQVANPDVARGRALEHLVSIDGDGKGGLILGARLLAGGRGDRGEAALVLTRLAADYGSSGPEATTTAPGTSDQLLLADSIFAYLGQPYLVTPDGRVIQPIADDSGYRLLVHSFPSIEEVRP